MWDLPPQALVWSNDKPTPLSCLFAFLAVRCSGACRRKVKGTSQGGMLVFNQILHSLQVLLDLREVVAFVLKRKKKKGTNLVIQDDFFFLVCVAGEKWRFEGVRLWRSRAWRVCLCVQSGVKHVHCSTKHFILLFKIFWRKTLSAFIRSLCSVELNCSKIFPALFIFLQSHCCARAWKCSSLLASKYHVQERDL